MDRDEILTEILAIEADLIRFSERVSASDVPTISQLFADDDPRTRANALTLLSLVEEQRFIDLFQDAARDSEKIVRLQALVSIKNVVPETANALALPIRELLRDKEVGVRKMAIKAAIRTGDMETIAILEDIASSDELSFVRTLAKEALSSLR